MFKYIPPIYYAKLYMLYNEEELEGDNEDDAYKIFDEDIEEGLEEWE